jgi:ABC-type phosphate transport system permease subunit
MEEFLKNTLVNVFSDAVSDGTSEVLETVETVGEAQTWEDQTLGVMDILLETGAAESIAVLLGGPIGVIVAIKGLKQWRKRAKNKG